MTPLVLDTDVASQSLKGRLPARLDARIADALVCVSFVTVGELTRWMRVRDWGPRSRRLMAAWLQRAVRLPYDNEVATAWGELSAAATRRGRPRPPNDTWIAACCLIQGLPLATGNVKDFADFAEHHGLELVA